MVLPAFLRRSARAGLLLTTVVVLAGCGDGSEAGTGKPVAAATAPQIDGMVRELAGSGVEVASIVAATADVHELELQPSQVRALQDADLILRPGRGNDAWAQEALDQVEAEQLDLSAGLPGDDRHWWMDPSAAETAATEVARSLDELDPDGRAERATRLAALVKAFRTVDADTKRCLGTVPATGRRIVTDHDAIGAYASRYGLAVVGTISPGAEPEAAPSAQRVVELVRAMEAQNVAAVFPIAPHGSELSATVAERGGAKLGEPLWADALPGASHEDDHAGEDDHADEGGNGDAEPADGDAAQATLVDAARLNGHAVASALGATGGACERLG